MAVVKGNLRLVDNPRKQLTYLFYAKRHVHYAPDRYTKIDVKVYDPLNSSHDPGIFVSVGNSFSKHMSADELDRTIDFLRQIRDDAVAALDRAQQKHRTIVEAVDLAISGFNGGTNTDAGPVAITLTGGHNLLPDGAGPPDAVLDPDTQESGGECQEVGG